MASKRGARMSWNGEKIKALRDRYGETQEEFANRIGVAVGTLRFWEQDQGPPNLTAQKLFVFLQRDKIPEEAIA